jgi:hypothetical protein
MATFHTPAKRPHHVAVAPATRLGRWALGMTVAAMAGLVMLGAAMAFSPDDPAVSTAWGMYDLLSIAVAGVFAVTAPIAALVAIVRKERAVAVYLAIVPFLLIVLHPLFMND